MEEINAYIYGKKIGTMIEHQGVIYFEYDKKFKLEGLEISPIKLHTLKTKDAYTNSDHTTLLIHFLINMGCLLLTDILRSKVLNLLK